MLFIHGLISSLLFPSWLVEFHDVTVVQEPTVVLRAHRSFSVCVKALMGKCSGWSDEENAALDDFL